MKKTNKTTAVKSQQVAPTLKVDVTALEAQTEAAAKEEKKTTPVLKVVEPEKTETKEAEKTAETKAAPAAKPAAKKAAAKPAEKPELKPELFFQYDGGEISANDYVEKVKQAYVAEGHRVSSIKSLQLYFKPEDNKVYYVINEKTTGDLDLD